MLVFARKYKNWLGNKIFREKSENRMIYVVDKRNCHQRGLFKMVSWDFHDLFEPGTVFFMPKYLHKRHKPSCEGDNTDAPYATYSVSYFVTKTGDGYYFVR